MKLIQQQLKVKAEYSGSRLDQALHGLMPDYSRSKIQEWIQQGFINLNRQTCKPKQRVYDGDLIDLDIPYVAKIVDKAENIEFEILHETAQTRISWITQHYHYFRLWENPLNKPQGRNIKR